MTLAVQCLKPHNESLGSHLEVIVFKNAKIVFQDVLKEASPFKSTNLQYRLVSWEGCPLNKQKKVEKSTDVTADQFRLDALRVLQVVC